MCVCMCSRLCLCTCKEGRWGQKVNSNQLNEPVYPGSGPSVTNWSCDTKRRKKTGNRNIKSALFAVTFGHKSRTNA